MAWFKNIMAGRGKSVPDMDRAAHAAKAAPQAEAGAPTDAAIVAQGSANYGAAKVIQLGDDDLAKLEIAYKPFKVEIVDIDVVLVFEDGSKIVIPGMALAVFSGRKPVLVFTDKEISAQQAID
ncbi:MAG: hypothetical protein ACO1NM_10445, partial [Sphingobium phenoxybenzoativorans]